MSKLEKDKILEKIYYDVDEGFGSVRALYEKAKKDDMGVSLDYVKNWMRNQPNKQRRNYKNYNSYSAPFPKYEFQIDIMDMISIMKDIGIDVDDQPRYGLVCIDIFSKKSHVVPMENKDGDTVYSAFMECLKVLGQPLSIYTDEEGSFKSRKLQDFFKGEGIEHIITLTHANQAERLIRTVKRMIADRVRHTKKPWVEMLKASLNKYNNTQVHSSTKTTPSEAHKLDNAMSVKTHLLLKEKYNRKYPSISEGDYVRVFQKGKGNYTSRKETMSNWSERKYKVLLQGKDMMNNTYYKLEGLGKRYNRHEILLVND